jgi:molybdenum cofactor cytidylyltransferase
MRFGPIPLDEAEGALLAHALKLKGAVLKKGRVLAADDLKKLRAAGYDSVVAAMIEPGEVGENEAAAAVAAAALGDHVSISPAFTGRCNLSAEARGVAVIDRARIDRFNLVDEAITIATVAPYEAVEPRQMVATVKIIPFAVPAELVERCIAIAREHGPLVAIAPFTPKRVGLLQTRLPGTKESILEKGRATLSARCEAFGSHLVAEERCAHDAAEVAAGLMRLRAEGCDLLLVAGASAIIDRRDVIPAGIVAAGGHIAHFGMPVDPGNLLLLARLGDGVPAVGLPGCARSPKFNGFDWVLQRLFADLPLGREDLARLGAGGLLAEVETRGLPRAEAIKPAMPQPAREPRIAALILAAGLSRRMGKKINKLVAEIDGAPMVARVVDIVLATKASPVLVVTGHEAEKVEAALAGRPLAFIHNPEFEEGLASSLRRGIAALPEEIDGALVTLGDMPRVRPGDIDRLIAAFSPLEGRAICVPTYNGKRGNPVLFGRRFFAEMSRVRGDVGARHLIGQYAEAVCEVEMGDEGVLIDIDSPDKLEKLRAEV